MTTPTKPASFTFDYTKYQTPGITVAMLDKLASDVFNPAGLTGTVAMVYSGIKLILALAYIWARDKLVSQEEQLALQVYQVAQTNQNQNEVNNQ